MARVLGVVEGGAVFTGDILVGLVGVVKVDGNRVRHGRHGAGLAGKEKVDPSRRPVGSVVAQA
jgi:hypothetical protein